MSIVPYLFQLQDVRKLEKMNGRGLLAWSMGLGKTVAAVMYMLRHPELRPAVIVCPASLKWNWEHEIKVHAGLRAEVLEGTRPPTYGFRRRAKVFIVNYDILGQRQAENAGPGWLDFLTKLAPQLVVIDECQYIMYPKSKRTAWVRSICRGVQHVLALSGTPMTDKPIQLFPILNLLQPKTFPSIWKFGHRFCAPKRTYWGWDFKGASHLDELHELLQGVMIRRRKEDVLTQLPAKRRAVVPLDVSSRKEYDHAAGDFLGWLRKRHPGKVSKVSRAERLVRVGYLKRLAAKLKMQSVYAWLDDYLGSTNEKLIIFAHHIKVVDQLHERYAANSVKVYGKTPKKMRRLMEEKFLTNPKTQLFIGNIDAAGVGWSARGVSNTCTVELTWSPGKHAQAEDRCVGIGRGQAGVPSMHWYLVARNTIEMHLIKLLQDKQEVLSHTLDGTANGQALDIFDKLCEILLAEAQGNTIPPDNWRPK